MRTVLIVEDTPSCSETLEVALTNMPGIEVRSVATAEEALGQLASSDVCAIVTDLHLPSMSGFDLIRSVRTREGGEALPILVISGDVDPRTPVRLIGMGVNAYFPKPYSPAEVRSTLEQLIYAV